MRKYVIIILVSILIFLTYFAYMQWNKIYFYKIGDFMLGNIGGVNVVVLSSEIEPETKGHLVPIGYITSHGQVTEVIVNYTIALNGIVTSPLQLNVNVSDIKVNSTPNPANVINVNVVAPSTIFNSAISTKLAFSINTQHLLESEYSNVMAQIINSNISYNVSFSASAI